MPPFGKELLIRFTLCSLVVSYLGFEDRNWVMIAPVLGHYFLLLSCFLDYQPAPRANRRLCLFLNGEWLSPSCVTLIRDAIRDAIQNK